MPTRKTKKKSGGRRAEVHRFEQARKPEANNGRALPIEIDPGKVDEALAKIKTELVNWANKGRYTRVRFKFRGKQLLPDIPLAAVMAAEGLTFYWGGILRALIFNLAGKAVFDVELINDSEKKVARGKEYLLSGDLDQALGCFQEALSMDRENANVHLNLGIALKLKGDYAGARESLERAKALNKDGPIEVEADRLLATLSAPGPVVVVPSR
jgi:tetratricopeptide (TPR) repeat protein